MTPALPPIKESATQRLPPHLRWKESLSPKPQDITTNAPGPSKTHPQIQVAIEQTSPPQESAAERSRLKEQARLESRTGVVKTKGPKGEDTPLPKYEGSDTRNATLASAKLGKPFPCRIIDCPAGYQTKEELHKHRYDCHKYCKRCKLWFENNYMLHLHKLEAPIHIICAICSVEFWTPTALDAHVKQVSQVNLSQIIRLASPSQNDANVIAFSQNHALDQEIACVLGCGKRYAL